MYPSTLPCRKIGEQALSYCWSLAVAAAPEQGKRRIERWLTSPNFDIRSIMRENLGKQRLIRMDADWVAQAQAHLQTK